jgi:membrane fusion protein, multidrug efflux system
MIRGWLKRLATMKHRWIWMLLLPAVAVGMAACGPEKKADAPDPRPVRTVTAERQDAGETVVLTGHIQAEDEASMAFRIGAG